MLNSCSLKSSIDIEDRIRNGVISSGLKLQLKNLTVVYFFLSYVLLRFMAIGVKYSENTKRFLK